MNRNQKPDIDALCGVCRSFLEGRRSLSRTNEDLCDLIHHDGSSTTEDENCTGPCTVCLGFTSASFLNLLKTKVEEAASPYGGICRNVLGEDSRLSLTGDIAYRYNLRKKNYPSSIDVCQYVHYMKELANKVVSSIRGKEYDSCFPEVVRQQNQGSLQFYIITVPKKQVPRPDHLIPQAIEQRRGRKRCLDENTQGGDPKLNLEKRLRREGIQLWTINSAVSIPASSSLDGIPAEFWQETALDCHVCVWRSPYYLSGFYTKTRRDVPQTPFYVLEDGARTKLGQSSVEEEILRPLSLRCGGISTANNDPSKSYVVFGMAKFHASGREDMNVRMLLPEMITANQELDGAIGGRPFVCEIIDSYYLPTPQDLDEAVKDINGASVGSLSFDKRSYGCNESGVGVSSLSFVSNDSFGSLQSQTEEKTKYYGCLCWSEKKLPLTNEELNLRLGTFPLDIKQRTPLRVLHRRTNMIRNRTVLSCHGTVIDEHFFRLHLSTNAGTCKCLFGPESSLVCIVSHLSFQMSKSLFTLTWVAPNLPSHRS